MAASPAPGPRVAAFLAALKPADWAMGVAAVRQQSGYEKVTGGLFYFVVDGQPIWVVGPSGGYDVGSNDGVVPDASHATTIALPLVVVASGPPPQASANAARNGVIAVAAGAAKSNNSR